jgi:hypothetical protein
MLPRNPNQCACKLVQQPALVLHGFKVCCTAAAHHAASPGYGIYIYIYYYFIYSFTIRMLHLKDCSSLAVVAAWRTSA